MIDLHTHSTFSDGSDEPKELARKAHALGLEAIALTDHDTTASHSEMAEACAELGLELVAGVEVSLRDTEHVIERPDGTTSATGVHVLAYFLPLDSDHPVQQLLSSLREDRVRRNERLITLLQEFGFTRLTMDLVAAKAGSRDSIGRPHVATAMFELHPEIVGERNDETWSRLFVEWLGSQGRAYVPKSELTLEEFVAAIEGSPTVLSIAHPLVNYARGATDYEVAEILPPILASLKARGVCAVEARYGGTSAATRSLMMSLARNEGMIPTGGSDYHGTFKTDVALGRGRSGDLDVPYSVLDELRDASLT